MKRLQFLILVLLASIVMEGAPAAGKSIEPPKVGDKAADFSLDTLDGKNIRLSELSKEGPVILIELRGWVGYQCPICSRQVGDFISHSKQIRATGARVVLVYPGPAGNLKKHAEDFISGKGLSDGFFFVIDPDLKFVSDWGLRWNKPGETAYPATFAIDTQGIVRFAKISHSHRDRATCSEVLKILTAKP